MYSFEELSARFNQYFNKEHFPKSPATLYDPNRYFLSMGGKRLRPLLCLMGNELFDKITDDAWNVATAIELFHNFTLIHDDIMDKAPLRRGMQTIHVKFGEPTALLAGDVMLVAAYSYLNKITCPAARQIIDLFNKTAMEVCEGQQLDMDFETVEHISYQEYLSMINAKTSVLLAASLKMGAMLGGALERNQNLIYEFGRKLGLAFQVQDDYLDAFGDPSKFGKQRGGDIKAGKKTFLLIHALNQASGTQKKRLLELMHTDSDAKVDDTLTIFRECKADAWAKEKKEAFTAEAFQHLDDVAVTSSRKKCLRELAEYLLQREY